MVAQPDVMNFAIGTLAGAANRLTAPMAIRDNDSSDAAAKILAARL
jgi:hypothetical protein